MLRDRKVITGIHGAQALFEEDAAHLHCAIANSMTRSHLVPIANNMTR